MTGQTAPVAGVPVAPPLPADLEALLRRMRLPYMRTAAPDILATARAQRWDPAEIVKALLVEEVTGRERSALTTRRTAAGFPPGKPSTPGSRPPHRSRPPPNKHCGPWNGSAGGRTSSSAAPPAPGRRSSSKHWANTLSNKDCASPGSPSKTSASC